MVVKYVGVESSEGEAGLSKVALRAVPSCPLVLRYAPHRGCVWDDLRVCAHVRVIGRAQDEGPYPGRGPHVTAAGGDVRLSRWAVGAG